MHIFQMKRYSNRDKCNNNRKSNSNNSSNSNSNNSRNSNRNSNGNSGATIGSTIKLIFRETRNILLDLLYPRRCPICEKILGVKEGKICRDCYEKLPYIREPLCKKCGKQLRKEEQEYCFDCRKGSHLFVCGRSIFLYEKDFRRSVHRMKFHNHREYLDFYADEMAAEGERYLKKWKPGVVLPIPMNRKKRKERGFDQSILLARKLSSRCGIPVEEKCLIRHRYTLPQKELDAHHRKENLVGAFSLREKYKEGLKEPVLLVDDIYTTGTTVDEVCRVLRGAGIREIYFLALCSGRDDRLS